MAPPDQRTPDDLPQVQVAVLGSGEGEVDGKIRWAEVYDGKVREVGRYGGPSDEKDGKE